MDLNHFTRYPCQTHLMLNTDKWVFPNSWFCGCSIFSDIMHAFFLEPRDSDYILSVFVIDTFDCAFAFIFLGLLFSVSCAGIIHSSVMLIIILNKAIEQSNILLSF